MPKTKIVLFGPCGARIVTTSNPKKYRKYKNAMVNPSLESVRGIPPHFWMRKNGIIVEMSRPRKLARLARIDAMTRLQWGPRPTGILWLIASTCGILGAAAGYSASKWEIADWLIKSLQTLYS